LEVVFSAGSVLRLYIRRGNWSLQTDEFWVRSECQPVIASGSQWWPDTARNQYPGAMAMSRVVRKPPGSEDRSHWTQKLRNLHSGSHCQATPSEERADWENFVGAAVNCSVCELAIVL
jgi:hypothetical protein